jgi:hypothetical protein
MQIKTLSGVASVGHTAVSDGGNSNRLSRIRELVEDSISADPQRIEPPQFASERMAGLRLALQQSQSILDRIDQRPAEFEQLPPCATGKDEPRQRSAGGSSTLGQLAAKIG